MKKGKKQKSPDKKNAACKNLLKKAAQGAVVLGTLNIALSGFAADSPMVQKKARDMAAQGIVDPNYNRTLENDPAAAVGKRPNQLTEEDRAAVSEAQRKIKDANHMNGAGGGCGMSKSIPNP